MVKQLFGFEFVENSALSEGWIVALTEKMAVAAHPGYPPMKFDFSKPQLGWQTIGEDCES